MSIVYLGKATPASEQGGGGSGDAVWGAITGTLSNQTDLQTALNAKQNTLTAGSNITINNDTISATDTTYSTFGGATSQAAGSAGLVPAPTTGDVDKYLKGDGTWGAVSGGSGIQNTATGTDSLTILGTPATNDYCINIGANSEAVLSGYDGSVAIGINAYAIGGGIAIGSYDDEGNYYAAAYNNSVAIGLNAKAGNSNMSGAIAIGYANAEGNNSIAIGNETFVHSANSIGIGQIYIEGSALNNIAIGSLSKNGSFGGGMLAGTNYSISIGFENSVTGTGSIVLGSLISVPDEHKFVVSGWNNSQQEHFNINLLDLQTGKIPNDRINVDANPTQNSTNFVTSGTIYNVLGNINTLLSQI